MGNECQKICTDHQHTPINKFSQTYQRIIKSKLTQWRQFPQNSIPQTVLQKLQLLKININPQNSQIWCCQKPKINSNEPDGIIYTIVSNDDLKKQPNTDDKSQQLIIANKKDNAKNQQVQEQNVLQPGKYQKATIFVFKIPQENDENLIDSHHHDSQQLQYEFQETYNGPINPSMCILNGKRIFKNGQYYQGKIQDTIIQGNGIMRNALGNHQYDGQWKQSKPHGKGVQEIQNKLRYEGNFSQGKWSGPGQLTLLNTPNGIRLQGNFINGNLQGQGKIFDKNDRVIFEGNFQNGKQNGQGKWYSQRGDIYEGHFVNGRKQGYGKFFYSSGAIYEGNFTNGLPDGTGYMTKNGIRTKGHWYRGQNVLVLKDRDNNLE